MTNTFRSIDELVKTLSREKVLLTEMFNKRKSPSFRYDYAMELTDYKEERIKYLIEFGIIRESGNFLEMEDIYLKFFEDVLQVNEEINVSFVQDYIDALNENIDYYLKENNENRKYGYLREIKRCMKHIALTTMRNVMDLKRNMDNTYKNEPNYQIKLSKLKRLDEKRRNISLLITKTEDIIEKQQPTFFKVAMDAQMDDLVNDVRLQLNDSYHNLLEIEKQIIHYLNLIAYQNHIVEKVRKLKYLRDQFLLKENTDIVQKMYEKNPVWMEPQTNGRFKLSMKELSTSATALEIIKKVMSKRKNKIKVMHDVAEPIPDEYLEESSKMVETVDLQELYNSFAASGSHLFRFIMNYNFRKDVTESERILYFCQIASLYADNLDFTNEYESNAVVEYPLIFMKKSL